MDNLNETKVTEVDDSQENFTCFNFLSQNN